MATLFASTVHAVDHPGFIATEEERAVPSHGNAGRSGEGATFFSQEAGNKFFKLERFSLRTEFDAHDFVACRRLLVPETMRGDEGLVSAYFWKLDHADLEIGVAGSLLRTIDALIHIL